MGFKDGIWTPPTSEEIAEFKDRIENPGAYEAPLALPPALTQSLERAAEITQVIDVSEQNFAVYENALKFATHKSMVSIILPVYGALSLVKECVNSVLTKTRWPFELIILNDASPGNKVTQWLDSIEDERVKVFHNQKNRGFAATVNRGIQASAEKYICVLNSDVLVTDLWLTKMMIALEASPSHTIVNPVTNNTALINIPMHEGRSYQDMNRMLERTSHREYPEIMPTGFCFLFRRSLIEKIGYFDEAYGSYGEEALSLDTIVPVPGERMVVTIDELKEGDEVFAVDGSVTVVTKATQVYKDRICYRVTLDSGDSFIADEGHNWTLTDGTVCKTRDLVPRKTWLPCPSPVQYSHIDIGGLDPWKLGAWTANSKTVKLNEKYIEMLGLHRWTIPSCILFNDVNTRIRFLQGFMDVRALVDRDKRIECRVPTRDDAGRLCMFLQGLGLKPRVNKYPQGYRIRFIAHKDFAVFAAPIKQRKTRNSQRISSRSYKVWSVELLPTSHPVRCIAVEHPSHTFLIGNYIPTHNTDFWFKSLKLTAPDGLYLNNRSVMADDCYVYHERGSSFSQLGAEKHAAFRKGGNERFHALHPSFRDWRAGYNHEKALAKLKQQYSNEAYGTAYPYKIAYLVKAAKFCGGMKLISDIVNHLIEAGVDAKVVVLKSDQEATNDYMGELRTCPVFFSSEDELLQDFGKRVFTNGIVVAAVTELTDIVAMLEKNYSGLTGMHHIQSYEPMLVHPNDPMELRQMLQAKYGQLPFTVSSSNWVTEEVKEQVKEPITTIVPGIDSDTFFPMPKNTDERFTILMSLNPSYWFKGIDRGIELAKEIFNTFDQSNKEVRIMAYGVQAVSEVPRIIGLGELSQASIAKRLQTEVDLFIDPSYIHSYGMTFAEALACGVRCVSWDNRGIKEVAQAGVTIFPQTTTPAEIAHWIVNNIDTSSHPFDPGIHERKEQVAKLVSTIESHYLVKPKQYRINVVSPHLRKWGGPTTILNLANILAYQGHHVKLVTNYTDFNNELVQMCTVPIYTNWQEPPECDLMIINSDNPFAEYMIAKQPNAKAMMLKLSHNARFKRIEEGNLRLPMWDHIACSTLPMAKAAMYPDIEHGWRHLSWTDNISRIGWYHYSHPLFNCPPSNRLYGTKESTFVVATLIHAHPLKGTKQALSIMRALKNKYGEHVICIGIGECQVKHIPEWLRYIYAPSRDEMATVFKQTDIWLGASLTEGLGRLPLEVMSAGGAVVATNTGAEFLAHEKNCLLYSLDDPQEGATAIDSLLQDEDRRKLITINGYNTACAFADVTDYANNITALIKKVMGEITND